jgi:hypothetical protein
LQLTATYRYQKQGRPVLAAKQGLIETARMNGAQYYVSKPLAPERFGPVVVESFLQVQQAKG